jgi:hypothetical protein
MTRMAKEQTLGTGQHLHVNPGLAHMSNADTLIFDEDMSHAFESDLS